MKVLLISFSHYPTLQNYLYLLKKNLIKQNVQVYTLGDSCISTTYDTLDNSYFVDNIDNASPSLKNGKLYFQQRKRIHSIIDNIAPDIVLFTSKHIWNFMMMPYLRKRGLRVFHVFHDPIGHAGTNVSKGVILYNKAISRFLYGIIVHSDISFENTVKYIKPVCEIRKVPLGEKKWLPYRQPQDFNKRLLIFGRISTYKGCEFIPRLAEELMKRNVDCKLIVAGKALSDVDKNLLDGIRKCRNVELRNEFIPESELHEYFYSTDASLILHKSISQSGVIIDAYRHGHPIICFDIDGISEFITPDTALAVAKFDLSAMADTILKFYNDFNQYANMSFGAYEYGRNLFSEDKMAALILDFFRDKIQGEQKR